MVNSYEMEVPPAIKMDKIYSFTLKFIRFFILNHVNCTESKKIKDKLSNKSYAYNMDAWFLLKKGLVY